MVTRTKPTKEQLAETRAAAMAARVKAGLPPLDPSTLAYEAARAKLKADRAARGKKGK